MISIIISTIYKPRPHPPIFQPRLPHFFFLALFRFLVRRQAFVHTCVPTMEFRFGGHVEIMDNKHCCHLCRRQFVSYEAVYEHYKNSKRHAWCELCDLVYMSPADMNQHIESTQHQRCPDCKELYPVEKTHKQHLDEKHNTCEICRKACANYAALQEVSS